MRDRRLVWTSKEKVEDPSRQGLHVWRDGGDLDESPYLLLPITRTPSGEVKIDGRTAIDLESGGGVASDWISLAESAFR